MQGGTSEQQQTATHGVGPLCGRWCKESPPRTPTVRKANLKARTSSGVAGTGTPGVKDVVACGMAALTSEVSMTQGISMGERPSPPVEDRSQEQATASVNEVSHEIYVVGGSMEIWQRAPTRQEDGLSLIHI